MDWNRNCALLAQDPWGSQYLAAQSQAYFAFRPRPDRPERFDQQTAFVDARDVVSFFIAGNGSGKTEAAACKCARFVLARQPPPRRDTPFWILTQTMHQAGEVLWKEKLLGHGHLPPEEIDWSRITWHSRKANHPLCVPLKPWPGQPDTNWQLEFKSFEMGRLALQGASIGGFWFSEQFPVDLFTEVLVRCRDYLYPGGQFCEFTPLEPDLCLWLEKLLDDPPPGWGFYRGNTEENREHLAPGAIEAFLATVPEELRETRLRGALASFEGVIYPSFSPAIHVVDGEAAQPPPGAWHGMGTDWGASQEHPHATVWGCIDGMGDWLIYDEYWDCQQHKTTCDRAQEIIAQAASWGWPAAREQGRLRLVGRDPHFGPNYADPSRPGEINAFCQYGLPTMPAVNRVYDGINKVRALLKVQPATGRPKLKIAARCKHLIEEMRKYRWRKSRRPTESGVLNPAVAPPQPLKRDDDTVDALRYLLASLPAGRPVEGPSTPARQDHARYGVLLETGRPGLPRRGTGPVQSR